MTDKKDQAAQHDKQDRQDSETNMRTLRLKAKEEKRLQRGHLWIYSNEVDVKETPLGDFSPGEQVRVESSTGKLLGIGYVNPRSLICCRMVSRNEEVLDEKLLALRLEQALALRELLFAEPYYRLVYGESDLLPGLVVDRFGDHLVVQLNSAGMDVLRPLIIEGLRKLLNPASILLRNDSSVRRLEGLAESVEVAHGTVPDEVELRENGVRMLAPLQSGQKTGWFYDQRPNRAWLGAYATGKRVLDVFSYIGSFAVQAAAAGAREVVAVDASRQALEMAQRNADLNGVGDSFTGLVGDAFEVLKGLREEGEQFELIVVDPPAFIKRKKDHAAGLKGYRRINELAMRLLPRDGLLLSASCSMHLDRLELQEVLRAAGQSCGRHVQIIAEGGQGGDHPIHPAIAETRYLKAFLCRVTDQQPLP